MKVGDKVRFLSEVGGGKVAGFQGKNIVLVEDEDGFEMPMLMSEVVVVGDEDYDTKHVVEIRSEKTKNTPQELPDVIEDPADRPITFRAKPEERKGGDKLSAFLAFVPIEIKELSQTRFESYLVNDSNRFLFGIINIRDLTPEQLLGTIQSGVVAALVILAIAIGTATPQIFAARSFNRNAKERQEKLLHEAYKSDLTD